MGRKAYSTSLLSWFHFLPPQWRVGKSAAFWKETIVHSRLRTVGVSLPIPRRPDHWHQWVSSEPLSEMTFCYPSYVGEKTKEKIDKLRSFSVCEKRAVPFFVLSKTSFFPTASHISDKQWTGQALNSCFWGTQEARRCPANSLKMSQNRFSVFRELQACIKPLPLLWTSDKQFTSGKSLSQGKW